MKNQQSGFSLIEIMVALALLSIIALVSMRALEPWLDFKQNLDTSNKIEDIRDGIRAYYATHAMEIDSANAGVFGPFTRSALPNCESQEANFHNLSAYFSNTTSQIKVDGYQNEWCIFISEPISKMELGSVIWYRNIAFVSRGADGELDSTTGLDGSGNLQLGGDDKGVLISGYKIQYDKLTDATQKMKKIASAYETYFTTRFVSNVSRDITIDYFNNTYDPSGAVPATSGDWSQASIILKDIGVIENDSNTSWESNSSIMVGNMSEMAAGSRVRSPATSGVGNLPYTAALRAKIPSPPTAPDSYIYMMVIGNY